MSFNLDHLFMVTDEAQESVEPPSKRHQGAMAYLSPNTFGAAVIPEQTGPPSIPQSVVKTPRPDLSIGLKDAAIYKALRSQGFTLAEAKSLLVNLESPKPWNSGTPLLYSQPTRAALRIRFPFLLVEGKSYATCSFIYEAQNQAAVSGACSLRILHDLDDLVYKCNPGSYSKAQQPMVFSVCTEGPIHQLWVHYTTAERGDPDRIYYMAQVMTCDVGVYNDVPRFLEAVDNVMKWGSGKHLKAVTEQLKKVARPTG